MLPCQEPVATGVLPGGRNGNTSHSYNDSQISRLFTRLIALTVHIVAWLLQDHCVGTPDNYSHCDNSSHYTAFNIIPIMRTTGDIYRG